MYYDSIEEAIKAAPDCTHVLRKYAHEGVLDYIPVTKVTNWSYPFVYFLAQEQALKVFDTSDSDWEICCDRVNVQPPPTTEPPQADIICNLLDEASSKVTAARFDQHIPAHQFLESGVKHMKDRASQRDAEDGERSMRRCVEAFNALEGTNLTETQGWRFMIMLKMARSVSGDFTADDYEDMAAYSGLAGECASAQENRQS